MISDQLNSTARSGLHRVKKLINQIHRDSKDDQNPHLNAGLHSDEPHDCYIDYHSLTK